VASKAGKDFNMDEKLPLICISQPSWDGNYLKSTVELMKQIALYRTVIYVDYQYTFKDVWQRYNEQDFPLQNILGRKFRKPFPDRNLYVVNALPAIPVNWIKSTQTYQKLYKINAMLVEQAIWNIRKKLDIEKADWLVAMAPALGLHLKKKWPDEQFWYYCYDQIKAADYLSNHGGSLEQKFLPEATGIICSSQSLLEEKSQMQPNAHLLENGVDFDLFNQAKRIPQIRPVIGYVGSIDDRLDLNLLTNLIENLPGYQFQFIGRQVSKTVVNSLSVFSNVELLPPVAPEHLGATMGSFSIGIIPFVKNEFTRHIYPLKINEYLALGLPVITTSFSNLAAFGGIIKIADQTEEFITAIQNELKSDSIAQMTFRKKIASQNSWANRAKQLNQVISRQKGAERDAEMV